MIYTQHIESKPAVLYGKPVIRGTRIGVDLIIEKLAAGETIADLLVAYPQLAAEQIYACLSYAAATIRNEEVYYPKAS